MLFLLFCSSVFCAALLVEDPPVVGSQNGSVTPRQLSEKPLTPPASPQPLPKDVDIKGILMKMSLEELEFLMLKTAETVAKGKQVVKMLFGSAGKEVSENGKPK